MSRTVFWLGCPVLRQFEKRWSQGSVDGVSVDDGQTFPHVTFDDFDEQNGGHPEMEKSEDELSIPVFPELGSMVLLVVN